jgi:hypothetical protein
MVEQIRKNSADKVNNLLEDAAVKIPPKQEEINSGLGRIEEQLKLAIDLVSSIEPESKDDEKTLEDVTRRLQEEIETPLEKVFSKVELGYFEEQKKQYCAIHAVNNLFGKRALTPDIMTDICKKFPENERSQNCNPDDGNYSNEAISEYLSLLEKENKLWYGWLISSGESGEFQKNLPSFGADIANSIGFLVLNGNKFGEHWTAWKKVRYNGNEYLVFIDSLNRTNQFPGYLISGEGLAKISTGKFKFPNSAEEGSVFWIAPDKENVSNGVLYNAYVI